jgi:hypothetical protein
MPATFEELKQLKDNKAFIIKQKKSAIKHADAVSYSYNSALYLDKTNASKEVGLIQEGNDTVVKVVINSCNIMDSHYDVHIPKIWNKSLSDNKTFLHLQEHKMSFSHVISDNVKAYVSNISWAKLGYDYEGKTQALIFETTLDKGRNPYMYNQYEKGYVKNHSVGMRYINLLMCINSDDKYFTDEKSNWDKYIGQVVNADKAIEVGYFFAVLEAQIIEGSAVLVGSNQATPTLSFTAPKTQSSEAADSTSLDIEPPNKGTQNQDGNWLKVAQTFTNILNK